jgi:ankyrin repeat protein
MIGTDDLNIQGGKSGNALRAACCTCHTGVVQFLLDRGADVNAQEAKYGNFLKKTIKE